VRRSTLSSTENGTFTSSTGSPGDHGRSKSKGADVSKADTFGTSIICRICFESVSSSEIVEFETCKHGFCQDCTSSYARATLENRRYPVSCPTCVSDIEADAGATSPGGQYCTFKTNQPLLMCLVLDGAALRRIRLSVADVELLTELELAAFSVVIHCRK
jgi:hypothetical protein